MIKIDVYNIAVDVINMDYKKKCYACAALFGLVQSLTVPYIIIRESRFGIVLYIVMCVLSILLLIKNAKLLIGRFDILPIMFKELAIMIATMFTAAFIWGFIYILYTL